MSSDETYLESFIESLSTLPHEVRRNMDLIRSLDSTCSSQSARMRLAQQAYIHQAEEKMMALETVERKDGTMGVRTLHGDAVIIPTTQELEDYVYDAEKYQEILNLQQSCLQQSEEKVAIAKQAHDVVDAVVQRLDNDLAAMEQLLQSTGSFQTGATAKPNDLAACQVTPGSEWILSKVIQHEPTTGMYKLSDEDVESNKVFHLPEAQVVVLGSVEKLGRGDIVYAVYPDTTSFYQASIVSVPRKSNPSAPYYVNFVDDSDEAGITHDKPVSMKHIMMPPYGAVL